MVRPEDLDACDPNESLDECIDRVRHDRNMPREVRIVAGMLGKGMGRIEDRMDALQAENDRRRAWEDRIFPIAEQASARAEQNGKQILELQGRLVGMLDWWAQRQQQRASWRARYEKLIQSVLGYLVLGAVGWFLWAVGGVGQIVWDKVRGDIVKEAQQHERSR